LLENGYYEYAESFAGSGTVAAEFVFNTSMTGYQEIISDPSYKGQAIVFTYPLIGNYGVNLEDFQSQGVKCEAIIVREYSKIISNFRAVKALDELLDEHNILGIEGADTRALTRQIRQMGAMKGAISTEILEVENLKAFMESQASMNEVNYYKKVIGAEVKVFENPAAEDISILAVDFGIKDSIIRNLLRRFRKVYLVPFDEKFKETISAIDYDGIFITNGPGDPRLVEEVDQFILESAKNNIPVTAICFGHQLIGRAFNLVLIKLPFGHHGGNHPVKDVESGKVYITAQNHNYAVTLESVKSSLDWDLTWLNLYDNTVEGIKHKALPIQCVQFHPEASPGPNEAADKVFSDFYNLINQKKAHQSRKS
jgi:carbamoyl-phosphate synthase small subunit